MSTSAVGTTSTATTSSPGDLTQALSSNNLLNQQQFLQLLTTQLTNQDPLSPMDDTQFLAQMAQFSTVQGVTNLGSTMNQLQGAELIGKTVTAQVTANGQTSSVSGVVQAARFASDGVHFTVNGQDVMLDEVTQIQD